MAMAQRFDGDYFTYRKEIHFFDAKVRFDVVVVAVVVVESQH